MDFGSQIIQHLFSGITLGSIYGLIALGYVMIYMVTGYINFIQGEFVMLGAMITASLVKGGVPLGLAILASIVIAAVFGAVFQRTVVYPARHASVVTLIIITIGAAVAMRGAALLIWGTQSYPLAPFSSGAPLRLMGAVMDRQNIWIIILSLMVVSVLLFFFGYTMRGKALRACAVNRMAASLMGVSPQRMSLLTFTLSAVVGTLAGIVIAPVTTATYDMGLMLGLKGFVAAVLGGLANPVGAIVGGFLLGVLEAMGAGLISSGYKDAIAFFVLLLLLFKKPEGLLGQPDSKRV